MIALEKAIAFIEREADSRGGWPETISLVQYLDRKTFEASHPGEDFLDAQVQRQMLAAWCGRRGIKVLSAQAEKPRPGARRGPSPAEQAKRAAQKRGRPYRLGLHLGGDGARAGAIGWVMVWLDEGRGRGGDE